MSDAERLEEDVIDRQAWSPSRAKLAGTCGAAYDYKYNQGLPPEGQDNLKFGSAIHKAIFDMHQTGKFDLMGWREIWDANWKNGIRPVETKWGDNKKLLDYDKLGPKILQKYALKNKDEVILKAEWEFPTETERYFVGEIEVKGIIDQIRVTAERRIAVIDFKTSAKEPDPLVLRHDPQFTTYWKVAREKYGEEPLLFWCHLRNGKMLETQRTEADLVDLEAMLKEAKARVDQKMFSKNFGYHCGWCSYKLRCLTGATNDAAQ